MISSGDEISSRERLRSLGRSPQLDPNGQDYRPGEGYITNRFGFGMSANVIDYGWLTRKPETDHYS